MDGNCLNSGDSKGKVKAASTSEDFQEHIPYPKEANCIFEEGKGSIEKDPEKESIEENLSFNAEENMPNQDQAFPDPDGNHVVDPAGVNDPIPPSVTEKEDQGSPVAFPDLGGDHVSEPLPVNVPSPPRVAKKEDQGSPVAFPDPGDDHVAEPKDVNIPSPLRVAEKEDQGSLVGFPDPGGDNVAEPSPVHVPSPPRVAEKEDQGSPVAFPDPGGDVMAEMTLVNVPSPQRVGEKKDQGSPMAFPDPGGDDVAEQSHVNVPSPPMVADQKEDQGSPAAFPDLGFNPVAEPEAVNDQSPTRIVEEEDHVAEPVAVNVPGPLGVAQEEEKAAPVAFPEPGDDHVAEVVAENILPPPRVGQEEDARERRAYACKHCDLLFSSAQALGGHQNGHKRQKMNTDIPLSYSSCGNTQPNYGDYPNSLSIGYPQVPLYNTNRFFFPGTPLGNPYSRPGVPNIQNPRSTTEFTVGQPGQSSGMFNSTQLPVYGWPGMMNPYSGNYGNSLETLGGRQGGILEGFQAPTINSNYMGSAYNSMGTVGGSGSGSTNVRLLRPYEISRIFADGFEAAGTSAGTSRNNFELSIGGSNYNETQDMFRGHDGSDGTIDLLSRVGMGSGEDAETNADAGSENGNRN